MPDASPIWTPSLERAAASRLARFMHRVGAPDYPSLHRWSVARPEEFWAAVWRFVEVRAHREPDRVVDRFERMPGARWFPGSELNFAENLLRYRDGRPALVFWSEGGRKRSMTYREVYFEVGALASALAGAGVSRGDRVAGLVANVPEAVVAMLASASLGAIWSSCSPDFGVDAVVDRFGQIRPKVLFAVDGYTYAGKAYDCRDRLREIARRMPSVKQIIVVPCLHSRPRVAGLPGVRRYGEFLGASRSPRFVPLPFDQPAFVLYSSGTTGAPKCIVHSVGGTLLQHMKEHVLHTDLRRDDCIHYFTSCGWMMWNWLVSSLAVGATVVLYDGSPIYPCPSRLFDLIDRERISVFGTSAKYLSAIEKEGLLPARSHRLDSLKTVLSTGSPLAPESFDYVYGSIKPDLHLASISGGTDIVSCFVLGNPTAPVYRGQLQVAGLGMSVEVFGDDGRALPPGKKGELVCTKPFPSMPVGFWNDPDGSSYRAAYFERFPGVWHHGDYCERTPHGGFIIWGRSDAVLNPGGVRIGTAEIYSAVESMQEVAEAVAVGVRYENDEEVILFVRLTAGRSLDDRLAQRIRLRVQKRASPRHRPARVFQVGDIPRTRSGKIAELSVRDALHGHPIKNLHALANPEALQAFRDLRNELVPL